MTAEGIGSSPIYLSIRLIASISVIMVSILVEFYSANSLRRRPPVREAFKKTTNDYVVDVIAHAPAGFSTPIPYE